MPFAGHALELVSAALLELEPGTDHEVAQRAGHQHVVRQSPGTTRAPSNIARKPSPDVFTSRPRKRDNWDRTTASCHDLKNIL